MKLYSKYGVSAPLNDKMVVVNSTQEFDDICNQRVFVEPGTTLIETTGGMVTVGIWLGVHPQSKLVAIEWLQVVRGK